MSVNGNHIAQRNKKRGNREFDFLSLFSNLKHTKSEDYFSQSFHDKD